MANLTIQDSFDPYYAGRDDHSNIHEVKRRPAARQQPVKHNSEIVLPAIPSQVVTIRRRDRRAVAH